MLYAYLAGVRKEAQLQAIGLSRATSGKPETIIRDGTVVGTQPGLCPHGQCRSAHPVGL
jgi:hypothetical protein